MRRRLLLITGSLAVAAAAASALVVAAARPDSDPPPATTRVLVATERIEAGTTAEAASPLVALAEVPNPALVPGALADLGAVGGMRALGPILAGQQIMAGQWGTAPTSPLRPPPGTVGVAVQLGDPQRVAGFVTPGSRVAVFATLTDPSGQPRTRLLLTPVTVLGVGGATLTTRTVAADGATSTEQVPSAVLTLALTADQAERVVFAATEGQVHLGLLGDRVRPPAGDGITSTSLFGASG